MGQIRSRELPVRRSTKTTFIALAISIGHFLHFIALDYDSSRHLVSFRVCWGLTSKNSRAEIRRMLYMP